MGARPEIPATRPAWRHPRFITLLVAGAALIGAAAAMGRIADESPGARIPVSGETSKGLLGGDVVALSWRFPLPVPEPPLPATRDTAEGRAAIDRLAEALAQAEVEGASDEDTFHDRQLTMTVWVEGGGRFRLTEVWLCTATENSQTCSPLFNRANLVWPDGSAYQLHSPELAALLRAGSDYSDTGSWDEYNAAVERLDAGR